MLKNNFNPKPFSLLVATLVVFACCSSIARNEEKIKENYANRSIDAITNMDNMQIDFATLNLDRSQALVKPLIRFTSILFNKLTSKDENSIHSPLSIHAALNLLALGAKQDSSTDRELRKTLGYQEDASQEKINEYLRAYKNAISIFKEVSKYGIASNEHETVSKSGRGTFMGEKKPPVVEMLNTIVTKRLNPVDTCYANRASDYFSSTVNQIDMKKREIVASVVDKLNKWAKEAGFEGKILEPKQFDGDVSTLLLSAVRVQAFWFKRLYEDKPREIFNNFGLKEKRATGIRLSRTFVDGKLIEFCNKDKVRFISHYEELAKFLSTEEMKPIIELNFTAIEMPLQGNVNLIIFDPIHTGQGGELKVLTDNLLADGGSMLYKVLRTLDEAPESKVMFQHFSMPKFSFESNLDLVKPLKSVGLKRIFDKDSSEISKLLQNDHVYVDKAKHQAVISVSELGIKAAGVTQMEIVPMMGYFSKEPIIIQLQNPFMFIMRYHNVPLFAGQLVKI